MGTRTIMVADDSPVIRRLIAMCFRGMPFEVVEVPDGREAVNQATAAVPDVLILDVGLPGKDGWTVLEELRGNPATAKLPVIMLTGHTAESDRRRAEEIGASVFMTKPFQPAELRAAVAGLVTLDDASAR